MKKLTILILAIIIVPVFAYSQAQRFTAGAAAINRDSIRSYFAVADSFGPLNNIRQLPFSNAIIPYEANRFWVKDTIESLGNTLWYSNTNPNGFISGIDSVDVVNALGYEPSKFDGDYNSLDNKPTIPPGQVNTDWNANSGLPQILNKPNLSTVATTGSYLNLIDTPDRITNNNQLTNGAAYITDADIKVRSVNGDTGDIILTTTEIAEGDKLYFNTTRARAAFSSGTGISLVSGVISNTAPDQTVTLSEGTGIGITGTYPNFTISSTATTPTIYSNVSRPINNTTFTISNTKQSTVVYTISISCTSTLLNSASGKVVLQYSTDGGSTWVTVDEISNTVSGVASTNIQIGSLNGSIPANASVRMVTTSSNSTVTYVRGQEVY